MTRAISPKDFGRVAVLAGGWSSERQVALWSGEGIHAALISKGVDATLIDATPEIVLNRHKQGFDRVFNILPGDRKSFVWGRSVSERVDLGGRGTIKIKKYDCIRLYH